MVVEYSLLSIGRVPPMLPLSMVFAPTVTQLLPLRPGVVVKVNPAKLAGLRICASVNPVAPVPPPAFDWPMPCKPAFALLLK